MDFAKVLRNGIWLFSGTTLSALGGYVYIFLASKFVAPDVIGLAGAIMGLQTIFGSIFVFGLPRGLQRQIGESIGKAKDEEVAAYFFSSFSFIVIVNSLVASILLGFVFLEISIFELSPQELLFVSILLFLGTGWSLLPQTLFISILRSHIVAIAQILSVTAKVVVGLILLFSGFQFLAIMTGYVVGALVADIVYLTLAGRYFKSIGIARTLSYLVRFSYVKEPFKAGFASWIPQILNVIGQRAGVVAAYGFLGATSAGLYFIVYSLSSIFYLIADTLLGLMLPVLSGMEDGRKKAISRVTKLSMALTSPLAIILILYPMPILSLIDAQYAVASVQLQIMAVGIMVAPLMRGYMTYVHAIGKYSETLVIGIAWQGSRILLYVLLLPILGELGIATAFSVGFFVGLIVVVPLALRRRYKMNWLQNLKILGIPIALGGIIYLAQAPLWIGVTIVLTASLFSYGRLNLLTRDDSVALLRAIMPEKSVAKLTIRMKVLIDLIYGRN